LGLLLLTYGMIGLLFQWATPLFETPDEIWHVGMAAHLARGGSLPVQRPGEDTPWRQEGSQPPLYYAMVAALTRWLRLPLDDLEAVRLENRHPSPGDASLPANKNMALHGSWERFPWRGAVLTLRLWRLFSLGMGLVTLLAIYGAVRTLSPWHPRRALGATALVAWNPMFPFVMGAVNNDVAVNALSALTWWQLARLWREGFSWRRGLLLGLLLGLAPLSKLSGLALWPFAASVLLALGVRRRVGLRDLLLGAGLLYGLAGLIAGWWFLRNLRLYGDPTGLNVMLEIFGRRTVTIGQLLSEGRGFMWSFWAVWGWFNITADPPVYMFLEIWLALAVAGVGMALGAAGRRGEDRAFWAGSLAYTGLVFAGLVRWTSLTAASQGRLLFPAIGPIAAMLWTGWETFVLRMAPRYRRGLLWLPAVLWMAIAWIAPVRYILPTYSGPAFLTALPAGARVVDATFAEHLRLLALQPGRATPGGSLRLTLFWECLRPTPQPWSIFLHPVPTAQPVEIPQIDRHPYRGLFSTTDCPPGFRFADPYEIPVGRRSAAPTVVRLQIGLWDRATGWIAPIRDGHGRPVDHLIVEAGKVRGRAPSAPAFSLDWRVGPARLIGVEIPEAVHPGDRITVTLYWEVEAATAEEWRIFVHLGDPEQPPRLQHDGPPAQGDLPSRWWEPGDRFADPHPLAVPEGFPPGTYALWAGLYRPDGERAPVAGPHGERPPWRAAFLGFLRVAPEEPLRAPSGPSDDRAP